MLEKKSCPHFHVPDISLSLQKLEEYETEDEKNNAEYAIQFVLAAKGQNGQQKVQL